MSGDLSPGFADPVTEAQACFRAVLDAMARPGRLHTLGGVTPPPPLGVASAAVLLTLVDHETPLWLDDGLRAAQPWLAFHCGAAVVADPRAAAYAVATDLGELGRFHPGTHEMPETAATLILQVAGFGSGRRLRLSGPGLRAPASFAVAGLPDDFIAQWHANRTQFPCGVDLILCAGDQLAALPRSVTIEEG
ncbi:MAG: phosphonate C-P lyase system protein PhnH [Rhodospirillales bacterium]|nr:phosphonate C-P lyase system protein PhnH [Rhodospirillales bacterium]MBN8898517.1 phosphonate C-P lyase system protein PhnH [Rhodospirillales bacterium]